MANFGSSDFDARSPSQLRIDQDAPALREKLKAEGHMYMWPHNELVSAGYPPEDVQIHCVMAEDWQNVRLSMKGQPTHMKLKILLTWWSTWYDTPNKYETEVQVGNYLGALRRGGQLDAHNQVRKYI